jgi:hypothetical protein
MQFRLNQVIFIAFTGLLLATCIYPVNKLESTDGTKQYFVVEANVSDSLAEVLLSKSSTSIKSSTALNITQALVYLTDKNNNKTLLSEVRSGTYQYLNPGLIQGETYQLHIKLKDGNEYESFPEVLPLCPSIDSLFYKYDLKSNYPKGTSERNGFNVYVHFKDSEKDGEYYQWAWKHYEYANYCKINIDPAPPYAEHFIQCDYNCWDLKTNSKFILLTDELKNGKQLEMLVERVPYSTIPVQYYLMVEQRGITKNAYTYFSSLKSQNETNGTPFDIPPQTRFSVNIHSVSNPDEKIIGIFNLFSSRKKLIYINRNINIPDEDPYNEQIVVTELEGCPINCKTAPCVESATRTTKRPIGWR